MPQCKYGNEATRATASNRTTRRHDAKQCVCYREHEAGNAKNAPTAPTGETLTAKVDVTSDGGEFVDVQTTEKITNWDHIFKKFDLDPEAFVIEGDSVRMSTWQQSKALEDGTRDIVNLYSYRARFARKTEAGINYTDLANQVRNWNPTPTTKGDSPTTYVVGLADFQLGKCERGQGTASTIERINKSLAAIHQDLDQLEARGLLPEHVLLANMGDHTEGVQGSYASQTHTVDLNTRDQLNLAIEINLQWIKELTPRFKSATYAACLCNHGRLSRGNGKDNVTDDSDNATGLIGDTLQTLCKLHPELEHVEFEIPRDEMITTVNVSGVNIALAHGHKISGNEEAWLAKQSQNLTHTRRFIPALWFTAHRHSAAVNDYGPYSRIQATTVDPGSKWYTDSTGGYARPGVTVFIAGDHIPGKFDHYRVL